MSNAMTTHYGLKYEALSCIKYARICLSTAYEDQIDNLSKEAIDLFIHLQEAEKILTETMQATEKS